MEKPHNNLSNILEGGGGLIQLSNRVKRLPNYPPAPDMMLSSKQQVVIVMVFISWTISNQILDFKITKAIRRLKDMNIMRETKLADSKVSEEVTINVLKMSKLPKKVVLKKVNMTMPRNQYGRKMLRNQKVQMKEPRIRKLASSSRIDMIAKLAKNSDKEGKVPKKIISFPMTVMSRRIRTIVRMLAQLVTVDKKTNSKQISGGPACMRQCLRRGNLHPAQCHQLC